MRMKTILLFVSLFLLLVVGQASANTAGDAPISDKDRVVNYTRFLESNPLHEKAPAMRSALLSLVGNSRDIHVTVVVCDILGPLPREHLPYGPELVLQSLFGNASFQIENPDKMDVTVSSEIAGVESALKAYSSIIAIHKVSGNSEASFPSAT